MNSPSSRPSPKYKNLMLSKKQSPIELKNKMRKDYKDKVRNCRELLLDKFRGSHVETNLRNTLFEIYNSFNFEDGFLEGQEESELMEEIKLELIQDEFNWWLEECEKAQSNNLDWSALEQDNNVICPVCQKTNFNLRDGILSCSHCSIYIKTEKTLIEIKKNIDDTVEWHSSSCTNNAVFSLVPDGSDMHVFLICESCMEMRCII